MKISLITILLVIFIFWIFWLPGQRVSNDYPVGSKEIQLENIYPWIWSDNNTADSLGEYKVNVLWAYPQQLFFGFLSLINIPLWFQTRILGGAIILIGFLSILKLLNYLKIEKFGKYLGTFFYLSNSYFLLLFDGGQLSIALVYSIIPFCVYLFFKILNEHSNKLRIFFSLSILVISFLDIRFIYILGIIFFTYLFFLLITMSFKYKYLLEIFISGFLTTILLIGTHFFWILPSLLLKAPTLPQKYSRVSQVDFLSFSTLGHSLFLQQPHWYINTFGRVSVLNLGFVIIPILVFLSMVLRRRDRNIGFWLVIALIGIFLSKGSKPPLTQVYSWLFVHIPGFSLFRDPVKFYFLISISYSILLAKSINLITNLRINGTINKLVKIFPFLLLTYLFLLVHPAYLNQMTGMLSFPIYQEDYLNLSEVFIKDNDFSRVFWIPSKPPLGISNIIHPSLSASTLSQKRPFAVGIKGNYETFNFLREAPFIGEIFDISGIGYIAYPPLDPRKDDISPDNINYYNTFSNQLSNLSWLIRVKESTIPLWKVNKHQDKFFLTPNVWWVIGSDSLYKEATKSGNLKLSKNALIFAEQQPGIANKIDQLPNSKIVLNNKNLLDLAASFIDLEKLIFPAKKLDFNPNKAGWWKREDIDLISWRDFLQTKYGIDNIDFDLGGGWSIGEGNLELKINSPKIKKEKKLLVRSLESSKSGSLKFYQDNQLIGQINTLKKGESNIRWFEIDESFKEDNELIIKSEGDINVLNALAILDNKQWLIFKQKAQDLEKQNRIVRFSENYVEENNAKVTYKQINTTKYQVHVSDLTKPSFLVFSENYDSLWKLNGDSAFPVYSLLNGFRIEKDGDYLLEFEAQKYVYYGLAVSIFSLLLILYLLFSTKSKS